MKKLNGISKQIIIIVFVQMKHEMKAYLFWIHYLLSCYCNVFYISILVKTLYYSCIIESWGEKVNLAGCIPTLFRNYLLCFIVHIKNWGCQSFPGLMLEGMKDTDRSHIEVFDYLLIPYESILWILEKEIRLSQSIRNSIINIVIINNSTSVSSILILFWGISYNHIPMFLNLPYTCNIQIEICNIVRLSTCIFEFNQFCLGIFWILSQIKCPKLHLSFMLVFIPDKHRVSITSFDWTLVVPLPFL